MRHWIFLILLCSCAVDNSIPVSEELVPWATDWNKACNYTIFHAETSDRSVKLRRNMAPPHQFWIGWTCGELGREYSDVCVANNVPKDQIDATVRHELGHIMGLSHGGTGVMKDHAAQEINSDDLEQARRIGWPCL